MNNIKTEIEPIPESFASIEEAAEWWDNHSLADYWDQTREVHFEYVPRRKVSLEKNFSG